MSVEAAARALAAWPALAGAPLRPFGAGLINQTFLVEGAGRFVLQRVSPIFSPAIHGNIAAVTARLAERGLATQRLVPTGQGALWAEVDGAVWRVLTFVEGTSCDVVGSAAQARAAGALVGRFHAAVEDLPHAFAGMRAGVHDTPAHLDRLRAAVAGLRGHRLHPEVAELAGQLLEAAAALPPLPPLPERICHGDLKFNNILFAGEAAVCLIDLDTVGPGALAFELGDAWRSWCNRAGEDRPEAALDLAVMAASLDGYRAGLGRALGSDERRALLLGVEWVSLELAARFAADALRESYFGWDPARFPGRGEHNLVRARGQWSLHLALAGTREERRGMLGA